MGGALAIYLFDIVMLGILKRALCIIAKFVCRVDALVIMPAHAVPSPHVNIVQYLPLTATRCVSLLLARTRLTADTLFHATYVTYLRTFLESVSALKGKWQGSLVCAWSTIIGVHLYTKGWHRKSETFEGTHAGEKHNAFVDWPDFPSKCSVQPAPGSSGESTKLSAHLVESP